jgi:putative aldouronate transport system substrate-binding protein
VYSKLELPPGSSEALMYDTIQRRWGQDVPKLILAKTETEFDKIWADYQQFKADQGYAKVQEKQTGLLQANKAKLGIP